MRNSRWRTHSLWPMTSPSSVPIPTRFLVALPKGRENARDTRHCISPEVWTSLNASYQRLQQQNMASVWRWEPTQFYDETASEINTFGGLTESTMYHDEGWSFLQLGRYVERVQGV